MNEKFNREFELYQVEDRSNKFLKYAVIGALAIAICVGIGFGISSFNSANSMANAAVKPALQENPGGLGSVLGETSLQNKISSETRMVYEYYYPEINFTDYVEATAPAHLVGASENVLTEIVNIWGIIEFSSEEVILRRTIISEDDFAYKLTVKDGNLAVFYEDSLHGGILKEVTHTPIAGLNADEVARLEKGIYIYGIENLMSALQDYGS